MGKLSALICAHNEERRPAECLRRLRFVDEIVVPLDRCRGVLIAVMAGLFAVLPVLRARLLLADRAARQADLIRISLIGAKGQVAE